MISTGKLWGCNVDPKKSSILKKIHEQKLKNKWPARALKTTVIKGTHGWG